VGAALPDLPPSVELALYDAGGRAVASPWQEAPPLPPELAGPGQVTARTVTPAGGAWAVARQVDGSRAVLYLPSLPPLAGLEQVGGSALGVLLAALLAVAAALLVALPRAAFRDLLRRTVRSYSKRLLLVYTGLLLVPLLLLNAVLVAGMGERLRREQRAAGERALSAAQRVLGDYLESLEPGFDLASELDDTLLMWLSRVVRHEINLYWGSEVWASTKPELFAARLLPRRIPGESYARLALLGYGMASRTNRIGDVSYLELYAPLRLPGEESGPRNFFLSMPLLAQQEEVARDLAALRRQALLVTAALVLLVAALGVRLSRSFTRPLTDLVAGTRRIAAGAPSLDLAPSELELAALVEAVDDMARRIAEGRERLVREKQVVERIVEHITAGVVSLDRRGRVLMRNRVAAELLGVEVGQEVAESVAARPRLAPVGAWLAGVHGGEIAHRTVRLATAADSEGDGDGAGPVSDVEREWTLVWVPVPGTGDPAALLVVEDATETLRGQRLEAWAEMARIIAHEIKNPLTPIRLNVEHMQQVWRDRAGAGGGDEGGERFGEVLDRCTANVLVQVRELQQIAAEFSTYSRIPRIDLRPGDLAEAMRELAEPYRTAPPPGVAVEVEAGPDVLTARFDRRLLTRAVRNLLENALRANAGGGRVVLRVERHEVPAGAAGAAGATPAEEARIAVLDSGPGIEASLLGRIFDPYFSTHDTGTGLGLPIARRIAEEHGGTIAARNRPEGGLEVVITLPL
jgi:signal transduction histidine kinase